MSERFSIRSNRQGYGAMDASPLAPGEKKNPAHFNGSSISTLPAKPTFLSALKPAKPASSPLDAHKIAAATLQGAERASQNILNPFSPSSSFDETTKEKWKSSYSTAFAQKCASRSTYAASKNACDAIIDAVVDAAAKYETPPESTTSIKTASKIFKRKDIALHSLNKALETYFSSIVSDQNSLHATHQQEISSKVLPKAIQEAEQLMGSEWFHILSEIPPSK